jgi:hypothetical protein
MSQMQGGQTVHSIFCGRYEQFWVDNLSTFMFAWDAMLQWPSCTWVAKYSGLYMRVKASLVQGIHGLFIIVPYCLD